MKPPRPPQRLFARHLRTHPQLAALHILRAALAAAVPALLREHPAVAAAQPSNTTEVAANRVVHLAGLLRVALDEYQVILRDADDF